ncbi:RNA polymerase sigma factor [Bdellovibrio sp. HCB337]|uniref:RNA polymerase sigma factor n=1 Tax=Bdellovibrio sp. HCB337 TaxID=3394358 RepID=UPI0039A6C1C3
MKDEEIVRLVAKVQGGDESARGPLIQLTQNRLYKFCLLLCHNKELAEDLCQETFIKAFRNIQTIQNPAVFYGWMCQVAKNLFIDHTRSASSKDHVSDESLGDVAGRSDMDVVLSVQKVLSQFEPEDRFLLMLVELEGHSYKEAGEITGLTEDAVRSKLHRLRSLFIKKFNKSETNSGDDSSNLRRIK